MNENNSELITNLAQRFVEEMQVIEPLFEKAFFRFYAEERMLESCASYTTPSDVFIVSALTYDIFFDEMNELALKLLVAMKDGPGLLLLTIDKELEFNVQFEYEDMSKWNIGLTDGGTGIPT